MGSFVCVEPTSLHYIHNGALSSTFPCHIQRLPVHPSYRIPACTRLSFAVALEVATQATDLIDLGHLPQAAFS